MSRVKKKTKRVPPKPLPDGGSRGGAVRTTVPEESEAEVREPDEPESEPPEAEAEVREPHLPVSERPEAEPRGARVTSTTASPLDQDDMVKKKLLEEVVTPKSKHKPPLPAHRKRKHPPDEEKTPTKRRQETSPPRRRSGRLDRGEANESVHIHLNLDGGSKVQSKASSSPKKITVWVSPGKMKRRARRFLEVTNPEQLEPIEEGNGEDEDPTAISCSGSEEGDCEQPSGVLNLPSNDEAAGNSLRTEVEIRFANFLAPAEIGSRPSTPSAANTFESSGRVDLASSGDDRGPAPSIPELHPPAPIVPTVSPTCTPPCSPFPQILSVAHCTPIQCNPESPEEALDRIMASLPTPARLRWLTTRAPLVAVSFF